MKRAINMILVLAVVGLFSGMSLVFVYRYASPKIEANKKSELEAAIFKVFPGASSYSVIRIDDEEIYRVLDDGGNLVGFAFIAQGNGYQGKIKAMAGLRPDLETLSGIEIIESVETPGLGAKISEEEFKGQFKGLSVLPEIIYIKDRPPKETGEVQAVTGATISSKAVISMLNEKIKKVGELLKKEGF